VEKEMLNMNLSEVIMELFYKMKDQKMTETLVGRGALVPIGEGFRSLKSNWD
jgi:hypothetical protein